MATGLLKPKRIVLWDTLLRRLGRAGGPRRDGPRGWAHYVLGHVPRSILLSTHGSRWRGSWWVDQHGAVLVQAGSRSGSARPALRRGRRAADPLPFPVGMLAARPVTNFYSRQRARGRPVPPRLTG